MCLCFSCCCFLGARSLVQTSQFLFGESAAAKGFSLRIALKQPHQAQTFFFLFHFLIGSIQIIFFMLELYSAVAVIVEFFFGVDIIKIQNVNVCSQANTEQRPERPTKKCINTNNYFPNNNRICNV